MKHAIIIIFLGAFAIPPLQAAESLVATGRQQNFPNEDRPMQKQPASGFQAVHLFRVNASRSGLRVDRVTDGSVLEDARDLPDSYRLSVSDTAVSFDGRIAARASAFDRMGRIAPLIAWFDMNGKQLHVMRTTSFFAKRIGFAGDGSLWAIGKETENFQEKAIHDVLRRYDKDGIQDLSLLPRHTISTQERHPTWNALLLTSKDYVASSRTSRDPLPW